MCTNLRCSSFDEVSHDLCDECTKQLMDGVHQVMMCRRCKAIYNLRIKSKEEKEILDNDLCFKCKKEIQLRMADHNKETELIKKKE